MTNEAPNTKLHTQALQVAGVSVVNGLVSFCFLFVLARRVDQEVLNSFLPLWVMANSVLIGLTAPLDSYSARFLAERRSTDSKAVESVLAFFRKHMFQMGTATVAITFVMSQIVYRFNHLIALMAVTLYLLASSLVSGLRVISTSTGRFGLLGLATFVGGATSIMGFAAVFQFESKLSLLAIILCLFGGLMATWICLYVRLIGKRSNGFRKHTRIKLYWRDYKVFFSMYVVTLVGLLLSNVIVLVPAQFHSNETSVIQLVALLAIVRIPITLINAASPPLYNRALQLLSHQQYTNTLSFITKSILLTTGIATISLVLVGLSIDKFMIVLTGQPSSIGLEVFILVAVGEILALIAGFLRIYCLAIGKGQSLARIWLLSLSSLLLIMVGFPEGDIVVKLAAVPAVAFFIISSLEYFVVRSLAKEGFADFLSVSRSEKQADGKIDLP